MHAHEAAGTVCEATLNSYSPAYLTRSAGTERHAFRIGTDQVDRMVVPSLQTFSSMSVSATEFTVSESPQRSGQRLGIVAETAYVRTPHAEMFRSRAASLNADGSPCPFLYQDAAVLYRMQRSCTGCRNPAQNRVRLRRSPFSLHPVTRNHPQFHNMPTHLHAFVCPNLIFARSCDADFARFHTALRRKPVRILFRGGWCSFHFMKLSPDTSMRLSP
jgi:hypothetical protein